ncbi:hypothetical protein GL325_01520 [Aeromicrobium sp. 636]|uniref:YtxH domain-containing protein n=1 Tax=Aeromicrobium senzhongii TaxID=2663859 RepID=A0A8I0JYL2_9ACTN|nr:MULTISPECIES: hypothetical protein [Aeromicrobium]MBC9224992.1 hypothetical protein [Aeromicrobium senzhongii]MCQ3997103.1 hypothetical protein [Aeromicrobium sp. 636]MTB87037.1 hypothetical protein [Aeromicrobium senzhongii]QNL93143.1 hypothetical protein H9L21_08280 [Aeromicrobium senzhongii]
MAGKLKFLVGLGAGYVLGARSGRERYDQIVEKAQSLWKNPKVQDATHKVQDVAQEHVPGASKSSTDSSSSSTGSTGTSTGSTGTSTGSTEFGTRSTGVSGQ